MRASSLVNTIKFDNNDALVMVTLMVFSLHGCTLLHSITEFVYRKSRNHITIALQDKSYHSH